LINVAINNPLNGGLIDASLEADVANGTIDQVAGNYSDTLTSGNAGAGNPDR